MLDGTLFQRCKVNKIFFWFLFNKFLFAENRFMPETHLRQPKACGQITKNKERIQHFNGTEDSDIFIKTN